MDYFVMLQSQDVCASRQVQHQIFVSEFNSIIAPLGTYSVGTVSWKKKCRKMVDLLKNLLKGRSSESVRKCLNIR